MTRALNDIWHSASENDDKFWDLKKINDSSTKQQFLSKQCKPGWQLPFSHVLCLPQAIK